MNSMLFAKDENVSMVSRADGAELGVRADDYKLE